MAAPVSTPNIHDSLARAFHSERLVYRSVSSEDEDFIVAVGLDSDAVISSSISLPQPGSRKDAQGYIKHLTEKPLISLVVCLSPQEAARTVSESSTGTAAPTTAVPDDATALPSSSQATSASGPTSTSTSLRLSQSRLATGSAAPPLIPIGIISLSDPYRRFPHHRQGEIDIEIIRTYQGQGYGAEALRWLLQWGFDMAGLHRIRLRVFGWNDKAVRVYRRVGFRLEGTEKESLWCQGRWWDTYTMGMLEKEWREKWQAEKDDHRTRK